MAWTLLVSLALLCGCAHQYLMQFSDGYQVLSPTKPKLQGTSYHFTDQMGEDQVVSQSQSRVVKIKTLSVVKEEEKPQSPVKPKQPKHWYFLWLA
jgi:hypothetical protein